MVLKCCIPQCKSFSSKGNNIKFHKFPTEKALRKTWIVLVRINRKPSKYFKVCSRPFLENNYIIACMGEFKILKKEAMPSINLPKRSHDKVFKRRRTLIRKRIENWTEENNVESTAEMRGSSILQINAAEIVPGNTINDITSMVSNQQYSERSNDKKNQADVI